MGLRCYLGNDFTERSQLYIGSSQSYLCLSKGHSKETGIISDETWFGFYLAVLVFTIIFPETRFTIIALPIWIGLLKLIENRMFVEEKDNTPKRLIIPFVLILITAIFFSDYRVYGVSAPRFMVMFTQSMNWMLCYGRCLLHSHLH